MANIRKRTVGAKTYYYLVHSGREDGAVRKREKYLGQKIPKDAERLCNEFAHQVYMERRLESIDRIRDSFLENQKKMPPSIEEKELLTFAIGFTYNTQRIEGSTLTRTETALLLEHDISPGGRPMQDVREAEAHRDLFYKVLETKKELTLEMLQEWHWDMFHVTKPDIAGQIRNYQVGIGKSKFLPPSPVEVRPMLVELFKWYRKNKATMHPTELAASMHLKLVMIHPFGDGNGRASRLVMNFILHKSGYPMLDIPYEKRGGYYNALERSHLKGEMVFLKWFMKMYVKAYHYYS